MKTFCGTVAVLILVGSGVMVYLMGPNRHPGSTTESDEAKEARARLEVMFLDQQVQVYFIKNGRYPDSLDALTVPQPDGADPLVAVDKLLDPWGCPYHYNPAGPRNEGKKPDVCTKTPEGNLIANWSERRKPPRKTRN